MRSSNHSRLGLFCLLYFVTECSGFSLFSPRIKIDENSRRCLDAQNQVRKSLGVPEIRWDAALAHKAEDRLREIEYPTLYHRITNPIRRHYANSMQKHTLLLNDTRCDVEVPKIVALEQNLFETISPSHYIVPERYHDWKRFTLIASQNVISGGCATSKERTLCEYDPPGNVRGSLAYPVRTQPQYPVPIYPAYPAPVPVAQTTIPQSTTAAQTYTVQPASPSPAPVTTSPMQIVIHPPAQNPQQTATSPPTTTVTYHLISPIASTPPPSSVDAPPSNPSMAYTYSSPPASYAPYSYPYLSAYNTVQNSSPFGAGLIQVH